MSSADVVNNLLQEVEEGLPNGLLPARVIADEAVHRRELERIFTRSWCFVGHESEIPSRGDYVQRRIGKDVFILVRGEDGEIRLLLDSCRHRGAFICRAEKGNASHFRCSYHGWTYKNSGELTGAPLYKQAYGDSLDRGQWGLLTAPHVESLHGFIFACLDPGAPSLTEYLGPMKWYFDCIFGQLKDGWEVIGEPQRWILDSNWKTGAENFSGDDYHIVFLHRSVAEVGLLDRVKENQAAGLEGTHIQAGNGHALSHLYLPPDIPGDLAFWSWPGGEKLFEPRFGAEMLQTAKQTLGDVGTVFPNFCFLSFPLQRVVKGGEVPMRILRQFQPRGPNEMESWNWILCPKDLTDEQKVASARTALGTFGSSGIYDQDDTEPWGGITRTSESEFAKKVKLQLNYQMGLEGSTGRARRLTEEDEHPGPGVKFHPGFEEGVQRGFYRRWAQFMAPGDYPAEMSPEEQNGTAMSTQERG